MADITTTISTLPAGVREEFTILGHPAWPGNAPRFDTALEAQAFIDGNPPLHPSAAATLRVVHRHISDWETVTTIQGAI